MPALSGFGRPRKGRAPGSRKGSSLLAALACAAALGGAGARSAWGDWLQDAEAVLVESDPGHQQTTYSIAKGTCRIHWVVFTSGINLGVVLHRSDCTLPLPEQIPLISRVLGKVLENASSVGVFRTLFWGRLYPDGRPDPELAMRLAVAAKRSALWDAARGLPKTTENLNTFIRKLANEASIYAELREAFRKAGLDLQVVAVEKVLVLRAKALPFFERLPKSEIRPTDRLPYDCMTWLSVKKAGPQPPDRNP